MTARRVGVGIVGGGMMGREIAAAFGRWPALDEHPVRPELVAVADPAAPARAWFERIPTVRTLANDYTELLADDDVDVVYVAVPHDQHEAVMSAVVDAGKDMLAEKPFGADLAAAERIAALAARRGSFVRVSSEMPFFPGAQFALNLIRSGALGEIIEAQAALLHSSDLDRAKPINWKRQVATCGPLGVMADLGMHVFHVPARLGWVPDEVFATLQDIVRQRPDGAGGVGECDTIDNAALHTVVGAEPSFPLELQMKRIAPGQLNTWVLRVLGMDGGVEFSTKYPKTVQLFGVESGQQRWQQVEVGSQSVFRTVTGAGFEFGFSDAILQMLAAFFAERAGELGERFGCATPAEALASHRVFDAAMSSHRTRSAVQVSPASTDGVAGLAGSGVR